MDEADDGEEVAGQLHGPCGKMAEGGVLVGDEGAYAAHIGLEIPDEGQIPRQIVGGLVGGAHHEAASHLVADLPQVAEATHTVIEGEGDNAYLKMAEMTTRKFSFDKRTPASAPKKAPAKKTTTKTTAAKSTTAKKSATKTAPKTITRDGGDK